MENRISFPSGVSFFANRIKLKKDAASFETTSAENIISKVATLIFDYTKHYERELYNAR